MCTVAGWRCRPTGSRTSRSTPTGTPSGSGSVPAESVTSAPLGADFLDRRLLFFTGKGGVGKSTVAAATALLAAERGRRVLMIEVDSKGNLTSLFEHEPVGF